MWTENSGRRFLGVLSALLVACSGSDVLTLNGPSNPIPVESGAGATIQILADEGGPFRSNAPIAIIGGQIFSASRLEGDHNQLSINVPPEMARLGQSSLIIFDNGRHNVQPFMLRFFAPSLTFSMPMATMEGDTHGNLQPDGTSDVGDLDEDGRPDQVIIEASSMVTFLLSQGSSVPKKFGLKKNFPLVAMARLYDIDGDGHLDLVVAKGQGNIFDNTTDYIDVYLGPLAQPVMDGAVFSGKTIRLVDFATTTPSFRIDYAALADIDKDGKADLIARSIVIGTTMPSSLYLLKNISF